MYFCDSNKEIKNQQKENTTDGKNLTVYSSKRKSETIANLGIPNIGVNYMFETRISTIQPSLLLA